MTKKFIDKYLLALEQAVRDKPEGGLNGFEQEWNLLDRELRPLLTVGAGPVQHSFVDYLRAECLSHWQAQFSQLEVFHWMIEWATRPFYTTRGAVYEARLMEASLINALHRAGNKFSERLHYWHGNLLCQTDIGHHSIPGNWSIAKRRYLEKCVDLYGDTLATAGIHSNLSLPDPLFAWDFMHLPPGERGDKHLDEFKSEFYITAARLLRAFASLFIATSASTPMQVVERDGRAAVILTPYDSVRNLTFPNPPDIDLPDLYRSYGDYLQLSYDLVRRGIRFGNNNWTPVRARSFAEPVERIISTTSDQLASLYARGLYSAGETSPPEDMAVQIEKQNLMARINLPMGRVEIRTDEGGHSLDLDLANLTLKRLLLLRIYSDSQFARSFRYDREDLQRARKNESLAATSGMRAEIENPFTGKPVSMRDFLKWTLNELKPQAELLDQWSDLQPLVDLSEGGRNTSEKLRARLRKEIGKKDEVPLEVFRALCYEREAEVLADVEKIASGHGSLGADSIKIAEFMGHARDEIKQFPLVPIRFRSSARAVVEITYPDKTSEILDLAQQLIRIPSVTACPAERLDEVHRAASMIEDYLTNAGLQVRFFDGKYPAVFSSFPSREIGNPATKGTILLSGHFDVVEPDPDDAQFNPRIEGDYLWGRGAADMKTVLATCLVWAKDVCRNGSANRPEISLLLVGNEENGESEAWGTPHVLEALDLNPVLLIAGERTGEKGIEQLGEICIENRGVLRFAITARGAKGHSGVVGASDLSEKIISAQSDLNRIFSKYLTLKSPDGWQSQVKFPFFSVGTPGIYNITASEGFFGVEIRPIPQDDLVGLRSEVEAYCSNHGLEATFNNMEAGVACDPENIALMTLVEAFRKTAQGIEPRIGKKLPATSARFAPGGRGIVWGQSGLAPHARDERHFIPSVMPYYQALMELGRNWI